MNTIKLILTLLLFIFFIDCSAQESKLNESLVAVIDSLIQKDAESLRKASALRDMYGMQSIEAKRQDSITHIIRASNLIEIDKILEEYGWPSEDVIGATGGRSFFAIVQHANKETRPKYLPIMREAVKNNKCRPRYLAGVEDRISTDNNELQIYGDQVKYYPKTNTFDVWPIEDPQNVDIRRRSIGLQPIAVHLKNRFDLDWDMEKQILRTQAFLDAKNKK